MEEVLAEQRRPHPRYLSRETPAKGLGSTLENQKPWMILNGTGKKMVFLGSVYMSPCSPH